MRKVKEHLCEICGETDPDKFIDREKGTCRVCRNEMRRQQYLNNPELFNERTKKYYQENAKSISKKKKQYKKENAEAIKKRDKEYYQENVEDIRKKKKKYYQENAKSIYEKKRKKEKERLQSDPGFKYLKNLRRRQNHVLKGKLSTTGFLGCTSQELKDHFESLFQEGMTHENHGEWHMDHIIPLSTAEKNDKGEPIDSDYNRMLFHYTNLQPLWAEENLKKSNKI